MKLIQEGPRNAKVMLVGEAPGATEMATGLPFQGGAGEVLNRMLDRVGIHRYECFVTNVCHTQPPGNKFEWFLKQKPPLDYIQGCIQLKKDIEEIKPNLVVALGGQPLRVLTGKPSIEKWRGSILDSTLCPGTKVIATYHPAYILRVWEAKAVAEFDLMRCKEDAAFPDLRIPERDLILDPPQHLRPALCAELTSAEMLAVDIECVETPSGWKLSCIGFSDHPNRAVVIPIRTAEDIRYVKSICEHPVPKAFQNGSFDCTVLQQNGIQVSRFVWDTMLAHHSLYAECASSADEVSSLGGKKRQASIAKGLAFLNSIYTRQPFYKDDGKLWQETGDVRMFWRYNALDAAVTREIQEAQRQDIKDFGVQKVFEHEMSLVQPLMAITNRGIKINLELRKSLRDKTEKEIDNLQKFLDMTLGKTVNVKSSKQIQQVLYEDLKLPVKVNHKTKRPSADKDAIYELAEKHNHPMLLTILKIRQRRDYIERYLDASVDSDGRMRCSFDITGTRSGRLSSRQSIYGSGTNLQNIPSRTPEGEAIRRMFVADDGKILVSRDYKQAEAWLVAYIAGAEGLIELLNDPSRDIHTENASRIFGIKPDAVNVEQRYLAKRVVHASNYGMEAKRLVTLINNDAETTGIRISYRDAQQLIEKYFLLYPEIRGVFWKEVVDELRYTRILNTPFGRKRTFYGRWDDKLLREAYSYIPQSTVGDLGGKAIVQCYDTIERQIPGAHVLLNVHDSILMQCDVGDLARVQEEMARAMAIPITVKGRTFTIPTDCEVGFNWGKRPKKDPSQNPNGLRPYETWLKEAS